MATANVVVTVSLPPQVSTTSPQSVNETADSEPWFPIPTGTFLGDECFLTDEIAERGHVVRTLTEATVCLIPMDLLLEKVQEHDAMEQLDMNIKAILEKAGRRRKVSSLFKAAVQRVILGTRLRQKFLDVSRRESNSRFRTSVAHGKHILHRPRGLDRSHDLLLDELQGHPVLSSLQLSLDQVRVLGDHELLGLQQQLLSLLMTVGLVSNERLSAARAAETS